MIFFKKGFDFSISLKLTKEAKSKFALTWVLAKRINYENRSIQEKLFLMQWLQENYWWKTAHSLGFYNPTKLITAIIRAQWAFFPLMPCCFITLRLWKHHWKTFFITMSPAHGVLQLKENNTLSVNPQKIMQWNSCNSKIS